MTLGPWITQDDKAAVMAVLDRGDLMSGREVALFEEELAAYFGKRHAVCVSSGTAALECAFVATDEGGPISAEGFVAILSAARAAGREPWADANFGTRTDVLGDFTPSATQTHDCAHRFDRRAAHAAVSCFSFNANKFIACCGGVAVTDNDHFAKVMREYRNHGRDGAQVVRQGRHLRMPEMNAALGRSQLKRIDEIMARREMVAGWYDEIFGKKPSMRTGWHLFLYGRADRPDLAKKHRSLADFRLFNSVDQYSRDYALLPIWPMMTKADCEAACTS